VTCLERELVVMLKQWCEEWRELVVRIGTSTVNSNARVSVLASREDGFSETVSELVLLVLQLLPHVAGEELAEE
jgi:hypothetical protein